MHLIEQLIGLISRAVLVNGRDKTAAAENKRRKKVINDEQYESLPEDALCRLCNACDNRILDVVHDCNVHAAGIPGYIQPYRVTATGNHLRMADEKSMAVGTICRKS